MVLAKEIFCRLINSAACAALLLALASASFAQAPIYQPGAPGSEGRALSPDEAIEVANIAFSPADVRFMQDMILHHNQAVQMAALVGDRTNRQELLDVASRIDASQADEIAFMHRWLRERGQAAPKPTAHEAMHMSHKMAGMATPEQMTALGGAQGTEFDRMFLELMITHHKGAITMVRELLKQDGSAFDPVLFEFTSEVSNSQSTEIERMSALLVVLSPDPRSGLKAGADDAGEAILNLRHVGALPRPTGFFDPRNPLSLPPEADDEEAPDADDEDEQSGWQRVPMMSFDNTDMAFDKDVLVTGSYHGFNVYRLQDEALPELVSSIVCPGGQGDVSIVGNLLVMSVEETRGRLDCGLEGVDKDVSDERMRGIRIFDISDVTRPLQVGAVQTCRGSHTHSVISGGGDEGKIIVYVSGTSGVRDEEEMAGCIDESPGDLRTALFRIDVIEIPVNDPGSARIVDSPAVFADPEKELLAGLWRGGRQADEAQETSRTDQCHDITAFPEKGIAAGACSGNGILFDISDPLKPRRIDDVFDQGFAYWHSAMFNVDGSKVIFSDEWGGGMQPRCRAHDPLTWGADAIYDIVDGKLEPRGHFKMPAAQTDTENCVAHNGSIVPVPGRDILVQAWYQGGISLIDFTDSANPVEIGYFDRGPMTEESLTLGGFWSAYWYNGRIYGTEILRGLDVFELIPSEYLSENEVAAAALADQGETFNPQQQFSFTWPAEPVVARAYIDQLARSQSLAGTALADLDQALKDAATALDSGASDKALARKLAKLAKTAADGSGDAMTQKRRASLASTLDGIAARLR